jgi:hypothetical protein
VWWWQEQQQNDETPLAAAAGDTDTDTGTRPCPTTGSAESRGEAGTVPDEIQLTIETDPSGATVVVDGETKGISAECQATAHPTSGARRDPVPGYQTLARDPNQTAINSRARAREGHEKSGSRRRSRSRN